MPALGGKLTFATVRGSQLAYRQSIKITTRQISYRARACAPSYQQEACSFGRLKRPAANGLELCRSCVCSPPNSKAASSLPGFLRTFFLSCVTAFSPAWRRQPSR